MKMTERMPTREHEERLVAYLLGELSDAESAGIEEEYLASEESFSPLLAIEAELYDAYARGDLAPERRSAFERRFLATPEQRQRLEFSRALHRHKQPARFPWAWIPAVRIAAAALIPLALVLAIALWWLAGSGQPPPPAPSQVSATNPPPALAAPVVVAFVLGPGVTRGGAGEPRLDIPADANVVRISADVGTRVTSSARVVLRTPEGKEIWQSDNVDAESGDSTSVSLELPVSVLTDGHYILTVYGSNRGATEETLADYALQVSLRLSQ